MDAGELDAELAGVDGELLREAAAAAWQEGYRDWPVVRRLTGAMNGLTGKQEDIVIKPSEDYMNWIKDFIKKRTIGLDNELQRLQDEKKKLATQFEETLEKAKKIAMDQHDRKLKEITDQENDLLRYKNKRKEPESNPKAPEQIQKESAKGLDNDQNPSPAKRPRMNDNPPSSTKN